MPLNLLLMGIKDVLQNSELENLLTLEVLATHKTGIHVDPGEGHTAQLLKVKV